MKYYSFLFHIFTENEVKHGHALHTLDYPATTNDLKTHVKEFYGGAFTYIKKIEISELKEISEQEYGQLKNNLP